MSAEPARHDAPSPFRSWVTLLGGLFIAGVGLHFLIIGHSWPLLSTVQLVVGCWMSADGAHRLLGSRRHQAAQHRAAEGDHD